MTNLIAFWIRIVWILCVGRFAFAEKRLQEKSKIFDANALETLHEAAGFIRSLRISEEKRRRSCDGFQKIAIEGRSHLY